MTPLLFLKETKNAQEVENQNPGAVWDLRTAAQASARHPSGSPSRAAWSPTVPWAEAEEKRPRSPRWPGPASCRLRLQDHPGHPASGEQSGSISEQHRWSEARLASPPHPLSPAGQTAGADPTSPQASEQRRRAHGRIQTLLGAVGRGGRVGAEDRTHFKEGTASLRGPPA